MARPVASGGVRVATDSAGPAQALEQLGEDVELEVALGLRHLEGEVVAVGRTEHQGRVAHAQPLGDVVAHPLGGGGREPEDRRDAQRLALEAEWLLEMSAANTTRRREIAERLLRAWRLRSYHDAQPIIDELRAEPPVTTAP